MSFYRERAFWWIGVWGAAQMAGVSLFAQIQTNLPATNQAVSARARAPRPEGPSPPLPVPAKPPVEFFRELLAMTTTERNKALADRPLENRKQIVAKVREYQSLNPDQRELRLRITELHYYLLPLMKTAATNRAALLEAMPASDRTLVEDRLRNWDKLPAEVQKELLENEAIIRYVAADAGPPRPNVSENISAARLKKLQDGIQQWQAMPEDKQQKILRRFDEFFGLREEEKQTALNILSEAERRQIEKTLRSFEQLNPLQRRQCIRSFEKFTSLSLEERNQFLKNAERWKLMSPSEREAWRELVSRTPLIPVGVSSPPIPGPPNPLRTSPRIVTNSN